MIWVFEVPVYLYGACRENQLCRMGPATHILCPRLKLCDGGYIPVLGDNSMITHKASCLKCKCKLSVSTAKIIPRHWVATCASTDPVSPLLWWTVRLGIQSCRVTHTNKEPRKTV